MKAMDYFTNYIDIYRTYQHDNLPFYPDSPFALTWLFYGLKPTYQNSIYTSFVTKYLPITDIVTADVWRLWQWWIFKRCTYIDALIPRYTRLKYTINLVGIFEHSRHSLVFDSWDHMSADIGYVSFMKWRCVAQFKYTVCVSTVVFRPT